MITDIKAWLDEHPTADMIEQNADGSDYIPIWVIENLLDEYCTFYSTEDEEIDWDRHNHQYAFHEIGDFMWLSTSFVLDLNERGILCGSMIKLLDYPDNSNWIATGIAEATKAGCKVLGNRFGKSLNARTVLKNKNGVTKKETNKLKPDPAIRKLHLEYIINGNSEKRIELENNYDLNVE